MRRLRLDPMTAVCAAASIAITVQAGLVYVRQLASGSVGHGALGEDFVNIWRMGAQPWGRSIYSEAVAEFAQHPEDPVRQAPFSYPPFAALAVKPLAAFGLTGATGIWLAVGFASLVAAWLCCVSLFRLDIRGAALALVLICAASTTWLNLEQGQMNVPLVALMLGSTLALARGRAATAGAMLGIAIALKGVPVLLAVYLLWTRRWRALAFTCGTAAVLSAAGFGLTGADSVQYLARVLPAQMAASPAYDNLGLPGVAARLLVPNSYGLQLADLGWVPGAAVKVVGALLVLVTLRAEPGGRGRSPEVTLVALMALLPLLLTTGWRTTALMGAPALWAGGAYVIRTRGAIPGKMMWAAAVLLGTASPAIAQVHYGVAGTAAAIARHDLLFELWGLDMTISFCLAWAAFLLLARAPLAEPRPARNRGRAWESPAFSRP